MRHLHGLPIELTQLEAAIHRAVGFIVLERTLAELGREPYFPPVSLSLRRLHDQRYPGCLATELLFIASTLRMADDREDQLLLCTIDGGFITLSDDAPFRPDLRSACSKLIHAETATWKLEVGGSNDSQFFSVLAGRGRLPLVDLTGHERSKPWSVTVNLFTFPEGAAAALIALRTAESNRADDRA